MIDLELEKFTASCAIDAGLVDAVQRGDCVINGSYSLSDDGYLEFKQNNFVFTDKHGGLRLGKFADNYQLLNFCEQFSKLRGVNDVDGVDFIANEIAEK